MTSFCAKKSRKKMLGEENKSESLKSLQKFLNYVPQWYLTGDQKKIGIYFWKLDINVKLNEPKDKKAI